MSRCTRFPPVMYSLTDVPWACIFLTAATSRSVMRLFRPLASQLFRKPWCTNGRVPRHQWPRFGGCVAYHACSADGFWRTSWMSARCKMHVAPIGCMRSGTPWQRHRDRARSCATQMKDEHKPLTRLWHKLQACFPCRSPLTASWEELLSILFCGYDIVLLRLLASIFTRAQARFRLPT